ncbi:MAG: hypothetical protein HGA38_04860 [Candidatus Moranbacteria bacterium]|nr:hypothetical protein [Candidatus Moranbacteria bacterium]NTW46079.1 hypothetical protein [Candidatus Moranbacteria bacterium]
MEGGRYFGKCEVEVVVVRTDNATGANTVVIRIKGCECSMLEFFSADHSSACDLHMYVGRVWLASIEVIMSPEALPSVLSEVRLLFEGGGPMRMVSDRQLAESIVRASSGLRVSEEV